MADDIIPHEVRDFILHHIDSVAQLEGLLMMRSNPAQEWSAEAIARGLYITEPQATILLNRLLEQGFITAVQNSISAHYQYKPNSPELKDMTECVADLYRQYLVPVTNLIHSKSKNRVQKFADAFKIRKD